MCLRVAAVGIVLFARLWEGDSEKFYSTSFLFNIAGLHQEMNK